MATTKFHMSISVREMLGWTAVEIRRNLRAITKDDGSRYSSAQEFRNALMDHLAAGHEFLPLGEACASYDFKTGCPGHESEAA